MYINFNNSETVLKFDMYNIIQSQCNLCVRYIYRRSGNFRCQKNFVVAPNHENLTHEIFLTTNINSNEISLRSSI